MTMLSKQRVLLAELCGWTDLRWDLHDSTKLYGSKCFGVIGWEEFEIEAVHDDLNAVHKVEEQLINAELNSQRWVQYNNILNELAERDHLHPSLQGLPFHAPAHHRVEALLRLYNKL